ncbi:MAG TPA: TonB family protein [Terriglobales bacterium]
MSDHWKRWEGQVVKGEIPLVRFLGGSEHSAVFLTDKGAGGNAQTAVKFVAAASVDANDQLRQWKAAADLDHPNVIRIFESGRCELGGTDFLYVLTEYGEEDLSQILPQRALADGETRQLLDAVLKGLAYVHAKGLVHGRLKPSNILATGDVVKISSDSLGAAGEAKGRQREKSVYDAPEAASGQFGPSADVWWLGVTLVEVLTQRLPVLDSAQGRMTLPAGIPEPFQEIAGRCLQVDPGRRWTVAEIVARLEPGKGEAPGPQARQSEPAAQAGRKAATTPSSAAGDQKKSAKWPYVLAFAAVVVVGGILMLKPKPPGSSSETRTGVSAPQSGSTSETRTGVSAPHEEAESGGDVLQRVMPRVSPGAQNTIRGTIRIVVKVDVDATGNVTQARLQTAGPSKYFARLALEAARDWKFKPVLANGQAVASEWVVRFGLSRHGTEGSAKRTQP